MRLDHHRICQRLVLCAFVVVCADRRLSAAPSEPSPPPPSVRRSTCSLSQQLDALRAALSRGSPALKAYLRRQLRELAPSLSLADLRAAFVRETDLAMIEELSGALATRVGRLGEPHALQAPLQRAQQDADPAARAAALRGLSAAPSVETMHKLGQTDYARLVADPAPAVRKAVVDNLLFESNEVYFGHDRAVTEQIIEVALAARVGPTADPIAAARLLRGTSLESAGAKPVDSLISILTTSLSATIPELRAAIVVALGGVPATQRARVRSVLLSHYASDSSPLVRKAICEALSHLLLAEAIPLLETLRPLDARLAPDIAAWKQALQSGLQEWTLVLRERQRLPPALSDEKPVAQAH